MRGTAGNPLGTLNPGHCFPSAIPDQHNGPATRYSSNLHEHYSEHPYPPPNEAGLVDVNDTRITDPSQLAQFYQCMIDSSTEGIGPSNRQEQGPGNDSYWISLPAPALQHGARYW